MPTNNIKHRMIVEARKIASKEYKGFTQYIEETGIDEIISDDEQRNRDVQLILNNHPEFDSGEFRRMIREFQVRNKMNKENEPK